MDNFELIQLIQTADTFGRSVDDLIAIVNRKPNGENKSFMLRALEIFKEIAELTNQIDIYETEITLIGRNPNRQHQLRQLIRIRVNKMRQFADFIGI